MNWKGRIVNKYTLTQYKISQYGFQGRPTRCAQQGLSVSSSFCAVESCWGLYNVSSLQWVLLLIGGCSGLNVSSHLQRWGSDPACSPVCAKFACSHCVRVGFLPESKNMQLGQLMTPNCACECVNVPFDGLTSNSACSPPPCFLGYVPDLPWLPY